MAKQRPTRRQLEVLRAYIRAGSVAAAAYELGISLNAAQAVYLRGRADLRTRL